jgi:ABC-type transporter Mla subunit MlaD
MDQMDNRELIKRILAGLFFITCVVMIVFVVFTIGADKGLTEPKIQMRVLFEKIGGLSQGAPVTLSGVNVGTVGEVYFLEKDVQGRSVVVTLNLFKKYENQFIHSTRFAIITEGILGEKIVEITTDPNFVREDLSAPVFGEGPLDVENLAELFGEAAETFLETSKTLDSLSQQIRAISGTTQRLLNRIEQRIIDGNLFKVF